MRAAPPCDGLEFERDIEAFLTSERDAIRGDVLEFGGSTFTRRLHTGATSVTTVGVGAHAPAPEPGELELIQTYGFDCVILVAPSLEERGAAELIRWIRAALRPGGTLLSVLPRGGVDHAVTIARELFAASEDAGECIVFESPDAARIGLRALTCARGARRPGVADRVEGRLEHAGCGRASGWAWCPDAPLRRLRVELWADERYLRDVWAICNRPDLHEAGKGDGCAGFATEFAEPLHAAKVPRVKAAPAGSAMPLAGSGLLVSCGCPDRAPVGPLAGAEIERPRPSEALSFPWLEIRGWAVGSTGPVQRVELFHNGRLFRSVEVGELRNDLAERFESLPWAPRAGFTAQLNLLAVSEPLLLSVDAVLAGDERVRVGLVAGRPTIPARVPVSLLLAGQSEDGMLPALTQTAPVWHAAVLRPGINAGHPGFSHAATWNAPFGDRTGFVWLSDGTEDVSQEFVRDAARALSEQPGASFAVASTGAAFEPPTLTRVLSGSAIGVAVLVRTSAVHAIGGIDEAATSAAIAQWDLVIRLIEAGHTGIEIQAARPTARLLRQRVRDDELSALYRKHMSLYRSHLQAVLLDLSVDVDRQRHAVWAQQRSVDEQALRLRDRRLERDRLARRARQHGASCALSGDVQRVYPPGPPGESGLAGDRVHIEEFLDEHAGDIHGLVLEYGSSGDAAVFGGRAIARIDSVPVLDSQPPAPGHYDCVISIGALRCAEAPALALAECRQALKPGGVLLTTVPASAALDGPRDLWRFSSRSLQALLAREFPTAAIEVSTDDTATVITGRAVVPR